MRRVEWILCVAAASLRCSVWYGRLPVGQCSTDADCAALAADGSNALACDPTWLVCVPAANASPVAAPAEDCLPPEAVTATECEAGGCAAPFSRECTCLEGAWADPDALVIGTIAPQTFATIDHRTLQLPYVPRWEKNVTLALAEYARELPSGRLQRSGRPLAVLRCNSNNETFSARAALRHLSQIGAPLVVTLTDADTEAIRYQAARANTPVICASCYAKPLETEESRLVWSIAPALVDQSALFTARVSELAASSASADERTAVVMLSQDYPGINELVLEVELRLAARGQSIVPVQTRPRQGVDPGAVAEAVIAARPRVIAVGMDSDFTTYYLRLIEAGWPDEDPRPYYVLSSMNQEIGLLADIIGADDELRRRISGTGFWPGSEANANFQGLEERFFSRHRLRVDQTQFGYDAFYAAAYAIAWADPRVTLDGAGVAEGLTHLQAGTPIDVGPFAVRAGLARLNAGEDIDLVGTSNALDWQSTTHATRSDVTLWCVGRGPDGRLISMPSAGPVWHVDSSEITGTYACP